MQKLLTASTTDQLESQCIQSGTFPTRSALHQQLAYTFAQQLQRDYRYLQRVVVFAGLNRTGVVGLHAAALLSSSSTTVECIVLASDPLLPHELQRAKERAEQSRATVTVVYTDFRPPHLDEQTVVVDAMYGMDAPVPFGGGVAAVADFINASPAVVVALDMPSGLQAEDNSGVDLSHVVRADRTYTFHGPKLSFFLSDTSRCVGSWQVLDVGVDDGRPLKSIKQYQITEVDMDGVVPKRGVYTHKYDYGKVLIVAGSRGMVGASLLSGRAALRSGAGLLTLQVPVGYTSVVHSVLPEALVREDSSALYPSAIGDPSAYDAIGVGPGIGRSPDTRDALAELMRLVKCPLLLDADALTIIAQDREQDGELLDLIPKGSVLTPHAGEFDRLFGPSDSEYARLMRASSEAQNRGITILLKGHFSATCSPFGHVVLNSTGNPGMATPGSGDVLTGIVTALMAKGFAPMEATIAGAFLHGYAGDLAAIEKGEEALIASDIIDALPATLRHFTRK